MIKGFRRIGLSNFELTPGAVALHRTVTWEPFF